MIERLERFKNAARIGIFIGDGLGDGRFVMVLTVESVGKGYKGDEVEEGVGRR